MSFLRLLSQMSVPPIEPRGIDKPFLVEQFIGRLKAHLAQMQCNLTENVGLDVGVSVSSFQSSHFYGSRGLCQPGTRHAWRQGAGECEACTLLAHQSSIQVLVSIESISCGSYKGVW